MGIPHKEVVRLAVMRGNLSCITWHSTETVGWLNFHGLQSVATVFKE
jgi:hypothetical protein